jgi:hypothetical protein
MVTFICLCVAWNGDDGTSILTTEEKCLNMDKHRKLWNYCCLSDLNWKGKGCSSICISFLKDDRNAFANIRLNKLMEINIKLS